jgi:hypothetical protein
MTKRLRNIFDQYSQPENHLTNSLLLVFNHNRNLMQKVLKQNGIKLSGKQVNLLSQVAPRTPSEASSIPDGYIYTEDYGFCVGIETKIQPNALRRDQLEGHLAQLAEYDRSHLLVLTPDEEKPQLIQELERTYPTIHFISWIDLINLMTTEGPDDGKNPVGQFVFDEFIAFMEKHYEMTPFTGFKFREGYDKDLATHYVKRVSKEITSKMQTYYPKCINTRPKMVSGGYPWEAWFPEAQVQNGVHFTLSVRPETINCTMVLGNGCNKEWKSLSGALDSHSDANRFKKGLEKVYDQAPKGAMTHLYFMQRHFKHRTKGIIDAATELNLALLLGKDGSKENQIWWDLLKDVANTKSKFNYELHVGYELPYDEIPQLKTNDATKLILRSFKSLKPIYELVTVD